jgi:hypothetical protein
VHVAMMQARYPVVVWRNTTVRGRSSGRGDRRLRPTGDTGAVRVSYDPSGMTARGVDP